MQASHRNQLPPEERLPPITDLRAEKNRQQLWLWLGIGAIVFLIAMFITAVALGARRPAQPETQMVVVPPAARSTPTVTGPVPTEPLAGAANAEEAPRVTVRSIPVPPAGLSAPRTNAPLPNAPQLPGMRPGLNAPSVGQPALPGSPFGGPSLGTEPSVEPPAPLPETPLEPARPVTPPVERPAPEPRPEPRRRPEPVVVQAEETGGLRLYFDADSSTFDRRERRLPLRVEVYVDGRRLLETDDPEKREFKLGRLPAGEHEVRIVPYVGNSTSDARTEVVTIQPGEVSRFKAVLRRSDGVARVSKFHSRD